jgi:membrane associated rhomboid family serine protease
VVVGASGAVFGILLAFGMLFPNSLIYLFFTIPIKAKYFVIIFGALELYLGITRTGGNIAHFAHLGGMLFGYFLIRYWRSRGRTFY